MIVKRDYTPAAAGLANSGWGLRLEKDAPFFYHLPGITS